jgi:hypothetical protein
MTGEEEVSGFRQKIEGLLIFSFITLFPVGLMIRGGLKLIQEEDSLIVLSGVFCLFYAAIFIFIWLAVILGACSANLDSPASDHAVKFAILLLFVFPALVSVVFGIYNLLSFLLLLWRLGFSHWLWQLFFLSCPGGSTKIFTRTRFRRILNDDLLVESSSLPNSNPKTNKQDLPPPKQAQKP